MVFMVIDKDGTINGELYMMAIPRQIIPKHDTNIVSSLASPRT